MFRLLFLLTKAIIAQNHYKRPKYCVENCVGRKEIRLVSHQQTQRDSRHKDYSTLSRITENLELLGLRQFSLAFSIRFRVP